MEIQQTSIPRTKSVVQRQFMLPSEHGAWVFLFSPLIIGLALGRALGGPLTWASGLLAAAALSAFLLRQPVTMLVKIRSGRRPRSELKPVLFWLVVYGLTSLLAVVGLTLAGYSFILLLAIPAAPVLAWHLWLVSRRAERQQMAVELAGSAALALAAPAAYWIGKGAADSTGWLLWGLCWLQTAGSIVYTYLRLKQRRLSAQPGLKESLHMAAPALVVNGGVVLLAGLLALLAVIPPLAAGRLRRPGPGSGLGHAAPGRPRQTRRDRHAPAGCQLVVHGAVYIVLDVEVPSPLAHITDPHPPAPLQKSQKRRFLERGAH